MHKQTPSLLALLLFLAIAPLSQAADLRELYQRALQSDPILKAAEAEYRAALAERPLARGNLLPQVGVSAQMTRNRLDDQISDVLSYYTDKGWNLTLTQPVWHQEYMVQLKLADATIGQASADLAAARQALILRLANAYFGVLDATAQLRYAEADKTAISRQLDQAKRRFEVGMIAITDVHEAQAAYDNATAQLIAAKNGVVSAMAALAEIVGPLDPDTPLADLVDDMPLAPPDPQALDAWIAAALEQNLSLQAARFAVEQARHGVSMARAGRYPTVDFNAGHGYSEANFGGIFPVERYNSYIQLQVAAPLYTGGKVTTGIDKAEQSLTAAKEQLASTERGVRRQVSDAYYGVLTAVASAQALKQSIVSSESALKATEAGFEVGTRTIVDVLLSQRGRFAAIRNHAQARYSYVTNTLSLRQAAGTLSEEDLDQLNRYLQ
ncbi:MAG TPA: type I secretion protein TolC [Thiotrichales bacterium]|nr:type I secretion protein TolC [Thiotrichales bacterium]